MYIEINIKIIVPFSYRVEEYDVAKGKFKIVDATLKQPRTRFGAATVPAKFFQHLPGGCVA